LCFRNKIITIKMSIFGIKKHKTGGGDLIARIDDLQRRVLPLRRRIENRLSQFQQEVNITRTNIHGISKKIENLKSSITITAESKGSLQAGKYFSFGNAGKQEGVGYVVMRRGYITGISVSSERASDEVRIGVTANGQELAGCEITLHTTPRKHDNFDKPFLVEAGDVINFVSMIANQSTQNTVAALLIEF